MASSLLSQYGIHSFEQIISARKEIIGPLHVSIDGGAGWCDTANIIAASSDKDGLIYAFEPFPGNHRFFDKCDPRIKLIKKAIGDSHGTENFIVSQVVQDGDAWADKGLVGYSSVGYLANNISLWKKLKRKLRSIPKSSNQKNSTNITVDVVRIDKIVYDKHIDFAKLDLQGAEYKALVGMGDLLRETDMLWIEFMNQKNLYDYLIKHNFLIFDTNYVCIDATPDSLKKIGLEVTQNITLSTSRPALIAKRVCESANYLDWFDNARKNEGVIQTDLLAINPGFLPSFMKILGKLDNY